MKTTTNIQCPVYCSTSFNWKKTGKSISAEGKQSDLFTVGVRYGYKDYLLIKSAKTGIVKHFEPVYDEDGYDGEFMVYVCRGVSDEENIFVTLWNY